MATKYAVEEFQILVGRLQTGPDVFGVKVSPAKFQILVGRLQTLLLVSLALG